MTDFPDGVPPKQDGSSEDEGHEWKTKCVGQDVKRTAVCGMTIQHAVGDIYVSKIILKIAVQVVPISTSNLSVFVKQLKCADNDRKYLYRTMKDFHDKIVITKSLYM